MKRTIIALLAIAVFCLCGCENKQVRTCQDENAALKAQLEKSKVELASAQKVVAEKDAEIAKQKAEVDKTSTTALESIRSMLTKENAAKAEMKKKMDAKDVQIKELEAKIADLSKPVEAPAAPAAQ